MPEVRRMRPLLGTYVEVAARADSRADAERGLRFAFEAIDEVQEHMSFHAPASDLTRLNRAPGQDVELHPLTLHVLRLARAVMRASGGAFDCTVGGLLVRDGALPDHGGPAPLPRGTDADVVLGPRRARLRRPVRLTLDGIAKGFAVDHAIRGMRACGVVSGWVNAGGDLCVFGDLALPVHRRELDGTLRPLGALRDAAVASTRVSAPGAEDPSFPAHIVAPPAQKAHTGVWTVLARTAWRADALTKVAATTAASERGERVQRLGGILIEPRADA
jgi:thiamine biosynthesis lipoprotein